MSAINDALDYLEQGVKLEELGDRSNSFAEMNDAAARYFEACHLLRSEVRDGDASSSASKRRFLEDKIRHYENRGRALMRRVNSGNEDVPPCRFSAVIPIEATLVEALPPPALDPSLRMLRDNASCSARPLPVAVAVPYDENGEEKQNESVHDAVDPRVRSRDACARADALVRRAVALEDRRATTDQAIAAYKQGAALYLEAVKSTETLPSRGAPDDRTKRFRVYLKERLAKTLDRIEQLQES